MPEAEPHILFERRGALGLVTLNRPKALNALTHGMCMGLHRQLDKWADDPAIAAVAVRGAGEKAFCAGGDIRALWESAKAGTKAAANFFTDEYRPNAAIAAFPKPHIALWHGYVMGGGAGVSVHGRYRLADSSLVFAMPETGIGILPDIGASYFLPRLPGESGMYLALSGARIGRDDAMALGLATHAVERVHHDALIERLAQGEGPEKAIAHFAAKPGPSPLKAQSGSIDTTFAATSVERVLERLEREGSAFAADTARVLRAKSPMALKLTFAAQRRGRALNLADCLKMEYRVVTRAVAAHDFQDGVRALLIDRNQPHWAPSALAAVDESALSPYFETLSGRELSFG